MSLSIHKWTKFNLWNTAFKNLNGYGLLFKCFKGCLPQILLGSLEYFVLYMALQPFFR